MKLKFHQFLPVSTANGPGKRAVVWVQGCTLGCPGCFNPQTHPNQGDEIEVDDLFEQIHSLEDQIVGVTISGGEPLQQRRAVQALLERIHGETRLSVLVFSGYRWEEIQKMPRIDDLLKCVDVLLAGRYDDSQRVATGLLGSANKTIHFLSKRYTQADLDTIPEAEVVVTESGEILLSGIDPLRW